MCMYVCMLACVWAHVHAWACRVEAGDQESTSAAPLRMLDPELTDMAGSAEQIAEMGGGGREHFLCLQQLGLQAGLHTYQAFS